MKKKVLKRNGTVVNFEKGILERSLRRSGAPHDLAQTIAADIEKGMADGDSTDMVYKEAFEILNERAKNVAMQYSLKKALFNLGPTGFPFERFVSEIFKRKGYATATNVHVKGHCITHEVDVLTTEPERIAMEVKFHNDMHTRTDVKSVLYIKARFDDLTSRTAGMFSKRKGAVDKCILITNTKFTRSAITYADCAGVSLLGWGYPYSNNLQTCIQEVDAHPITCLPSLSQSAARDLFSEDVVTCRGLLEREDLLSNMQNADTIAAEAEMLCTPSGRR